MRSWAWSAGCLVPALAMNSVTAEAQQVFVPPVEFGDRVQSVEQISANWVGSAALPPLLAPAEGPQTYPLQWGPVRFHPHLGYQVVYGDGVLRGTNNPQTTVLHTINPGGFFQLGKFWNFDITASLNRYSNADFNNSTAYYWALRGHVPREKWLLDFGYQGTMSEQTQLETGSQIQQNTHLMSASGIYNYNTRMSVELSGSLDARLASGGVAGQSVGDYWTGSTLEWLNFQVTSRTSVGLGLGAGYNMADPGDDWVFEQAQARLVWTPGAKFSAQASGGLQAQQFTGGASGTEVFPLFAVLAAYRPFEQTSVSLSAKHEIGNAYQENVFTETTTVGVGLRQRLLGRVFLDVAPSYNFRKYEATPSGSFAGREDDFVAVYAGLSTTFFKKLNASVFYQFSDNSSSDEGLSFDSTQVGLKVDYRY